MSLIILTVGVIIVQNSGTTDAHSSKNVRAKSGRGNSVFVDATIGGCTKFPESFKLPDIPTKLVHVEPMQMASVLINISQSELAESKSVATDKIKEFIRDPY